MGLDVILGIKDYKNHAVLLGHAGYLMLCVAHYWHFWDIGVIYARAMNYLWMLLGVNTRNGGRR